MKLIDYGGVITFRIPATWIAEESNDGGVYRPTSARPYPTLRLRVTTFSSHRDRVDGLAILKLVATMPGARSVSLTPKGYPIAYSVRTERSLAGETYQLHAWKIGQAMPSADGCIALFTLALGSDAQLGDPEKALLEAMTSEIQNVRFHAK
jgi:hypothetical protein